MPPCCRCTTSASPARSPSPARAFSTTRRSVERPNPATIVRRHGRDDCFPKRRDHRREIVADRSHRTLRRRHSFRGNSTASSTTDLLFTGLIVEGGGELRFHDDAWTGYTAI